MNNGKICVSVCAETVDEFIQKITQAAEIADVIELRFDCLRDDDEFKLLFSEIDLVRNVLEKPLLFTYRPKEQGGKRNLRFDQRRNFWSWRDDNKQTYGSKFDNKTFLLTDLIDLEFDLVFDDYADRFNINDDVFSISNWALRNTGIFRNAKFDDYSNKYFDTRDYNKKFDEKIICSFHDFIGIPKNLNQIAKAMTFELIDYPKIALQAAEITDSLAVWNLLEKAKSENNQLIPIAMGEAGKWTRILGLAFGSPLTYASLEDGNETAPGQISAKDLIEVYRVKELNEETEVYGIIGKPVSHSLSPYMHNAAFKHHGLNAVYIPFEVANLDEFIKRMVREETQEIDWNLKGFSVTIPHKEAICKHLDFIDEDAKAIGAVNTVQIIDGKLYGYNTDAHGFIEPLKNSYGDLKDANVGIIGNGGAARACIYRLKKEGSIVTVFARNVEKAKSLAEEFGIKLSELRIANHELQNQDILVNTTPLGTIGEFENETPATAEQLKNLHLVYDLVYNPFETLFMREAKSVYVPTIGGLAMLVAQGMKQFEIWTGLEAPMKIMSQAALQRLR